MSPLTVVVAIAEVIGIVEVVDVGKVVVTFLVVNTVLIAARDVVGRDLLKDVGRVTRVGLE
jgi:hypothetical protein